MKDNAIKFLYALDCYLLYALSGVLASLGVVAYYSIVAAKDFGSLGETLDVDSFSTYISDVLSGKASVVLLVSYLLVIFSVTAVFFFRRGNMSSYTGLSYARPVSLLSSLCLGVFLNLLVSSFVPAESSGGETVTGILVLCIILGPVVEEIMFRGILLKMFGGAVGVFFSIIVTSLLFSVSHGNAVQIAYTFVLGLVLAVVRYKSTSLWSAIAAHLSFNISGAFFGYLNIELDVIEIAVVAIVTILFVLLSCTGGRKVRKRA